MMLDIASSPSTDSDDHRCGHPGPDTAPSRPILIGLCSRAMYSGKSTVAQYLVDEHGFVALKFAGTLKRMIRHLLDITGYDPVFIEAAVEGDQKEAMLVDFRSHLIRVLRIGVVRPVEAMLWAMLNDLAIDDDTINVMLHNGGLDDPVDGIDVTPRLLIYSLNKWLIDCVIARADISCRWLMQSLGTEWGRQCVRSDLWIAIARTKAEAWMRLNGGRPVVFDDMRFRNEMQAILDLGGHAWRIERNSAQVATAHASEGELDGEMMLTLANDGSIADLHDLVDGAIAGLSRLHGIRDSLNTGFPRQ
jgi:hypothetical protein